MHSELIRALLAAVLVGILPGYFWAKCLASSADFAERIAYSIALSVTLVPAAALLQVSLFDKGVTPVIAAASVSTVFVAGIGAYLWLGPARYPDGPSLAPTPAPPGLFALVPLLAAFGLVLGASVGLMPGDRFMFTIALLFVVAGAVYLIESRRGGPKPPRGEPQEEPQGEPLGGRLSAVLRTLGLTAVLVLAVVRGYLGPIKHDWPYLRGGDQFSHAVMSNLMMTEGEIDQYLIYPPGFHTLSALISRLSGLEPLEIFPVLAPALMVLPALSCYALARRLWGYGVVAAFFSGVLLVGPYASFADARYPNVVSANFLIVMAVAALIETYGSPRARSGVLFAALGSSVVLYHQVASFYLALLLALIAVLVLPYLLLRHRGLALLLWLSLLGVVCVIYAWDTYDLPRLVGGLLGGSGAGAGGTAVTNAIGSQEPLSLEHLVEMTSQPVLWLGLLGVFLVLSELRRGRVDEPQAPAYLTLLLWASLLFVGSRTAMSGFPQRFERDLGIPLAVLAAFAFVTILRSPRLHTASLPTRLVAVIAATLTIVVVGLQAAENVSEADAPSANVISPEVAEAGEWLGAHRTDGNVVVTPYLNDHIPGSAMLAMGGYTGLRSYTLERIRSPRALPPSGKEPLRAAQWVMHHPLGERTRAILERYHIGYVVLFKRYPGVPWRTFESRSNLYAKAFENGAMVIFAPRGTSSPSG